MSSSLGGLFDDRSLAGNGEWSTVDDSSTVDGEVDGLEDGLLGRAGIGCCNSVPIIWKDKVEEDEGFVFFFFDSFTTVRGGLASIPSVFAMANSSRIDISCDGKDDGKADLVMLALAVSDEIGSRSAAVTRVERSY